MAGNGWKLNGNKKWVVMLTVVATALGIAVSWQQLDLPALALESDVANLEREHLQRMENLRAEQLEIKSLVLNDIKLRLSRELNSIDQRIWQRREDSEAVPEWMLRKKSDIEQQIDQINRELRRIVNGSSNG